MTSAGAERPLVRAAGGVVWRPAGEGVEVLVAHRPHRRDWSFPKGKLEPGEDEATAAWREVAEETGLRCRLGDDLGEVSYRDQKDRPKVVRWWSMTVEGGAFTPNDEVDEVRWLPPAEAGALLTWPTDVEVLARFCRARGLPTG